MKNVAIKIKKGDTLSGLAKKYNTTVSSLAKTNNIKNVNKIYAGATLRLPTVSKPTPVKTVPKVTPPKGTVKPMTTKVTPTKTVASPTSSKVSEGTGLMSGLLSTTPIQSTYQDTSTASPGSGWNQERENAFDTVDSYNNWATESSLGNTTEPPPVSQDVYNSALDLTDISSNQLSDSYSGIVNNYNGRIEAIQRQLDEQTKQYEDLVNQNKYNQLQISNASANAPVRNGEHLFSPGTAPTTSANGNPVGYTAGNTINDTLFRYLNGLWKGGF